jgi:formate hydrogenlyase transcriptional activator
VIAVENCFAYEEIARLRDRLSRENEYLQEEIRTEHNFDEIAGNSPALLRVLRKVEQVAATDATVLISGETGTGKELFARALHARSPRRERPLVKVNCAAISAGLVESELFGHVKGAFTGATGDRDGRFALADKGTLFLDEVGELAPETQVKLLRVLQEHEFEPVGSSRSRTVDVRILAATNRDLAKEVAAGRFRADLFYRLNVFPIDVPPLRQRREDIAPLALLFLQRCAARFARPVRRIAPETLQRLTDYDWPGNVRELQNIVERAVLLSDGPVLEVGPDLLSGASATMASAPETAAAHPPGSGRGGTLEDVQRSHILEALERTNGVIEGPGGAAARLGIHPNTLRSRMKKLGIRASRRAHVAQEEAG